MRFDSVPALLLLMLTSVTLSTGCVTKARFDALDSEYTQTAREMRQTINQLESELETATASVTTLEPRVKELTTMNLALTENIDEMEKALAESQERQALADARIAEYKNLVGRFQEMIDAGTLKVQIVNGRMVVALATDVLFNSGSARLSSTGAEAIAQVAAVLQTIPKRGFQVEGHTDNVPISNEDYGNNWELAFDRSMNVVQTMIDAGMDAGRVSAASFGEHNPIASNETDEEQAKNRRIEIVVVPDLSSLPGFDQLKKMGSDK